MTGGARWAGLRRRLVIQTVVITLAASVALVLAVQLLLASSVKRETASVLSARADAVFGTLSVDEAGELAILETPDGELDRNAWVFDSDGRLIDGTLPTGALGAAITELSSARVTRLVTIDDAVRLIAVPAPRPSAGPQAGVAVVGLDLGPYEASERYALIVSLVLGGLLVVVAGLIAWWAAHRALSPVATMASRAASWSEHDLDRRFGTGPGGDEISTLGRTLDLLLDRVAGTIRAEQRLSSELAHELRTPLATLRAQTELAQLSASDDDVVEALDRVLRCADTMDETITALMTLARAQAVQSFEPSPVAEAIVRALEEATGHNAESGPEIRFADHTGGAAVAAPIELVVRVLVPLLDNAVRHATSRVMIEVSKVDGRVEITVTDDGPGIPAAVGELLFAPGVRTGAGDGAGLGLALSRRIARGVGGNVVAGEARPSSGRTAGAVFSVALPLARPV
ncbi:MAG: sensor histidine kinase [Geodermatophilaceae bacterium]